MVVNGWCSWVVDGGVSVVMVVSKWCMVVLGFVVDGLCWVGEVDGLWWLVDRCV